jgi:outer membrane protein assembly factor BamB
VYARSRSDGSFVWQWPVDVNPDATPVLGKGKMNSTPVLTDGKLIVGVMDSDVLLAALDPADGQLIWTFTPQK